MKHVAAWISVMAGLTLAGGCVQGEKQFPRWEAARLAILSAPPPAIPVDPQTEAAENAYRACLVRAARYADDGSADVAGLASLIAPMCYPQFSAFEAAAAANFSDRDRFVFDYAGDDRQIALASDAVRAERGQAALSGPAAPAQELPLPHRD